MKSDEAVSRIEGVLFSRVHDRAVLYSGEQGKAIVLNASGALLWDALEKPRRPRELTTVLIDRYPHLSAERAHADVNAFLERLLAENVLRPAS